MLNTIIEILSLDEVQIGLALYLLISVYIGIYRIAQTAMFENYMSDVPIGDSCYYKPRALLFNIWVYVFFPAWIIIWIWRGIAHLINKIIYHY